MSHSLRNSIFRSVRVSKYFNWTGILFITNFYPIETIFKSHKILKKKRGLKKNEQSKIKEG